MTIEFAKKTVLDWGIEMSDELPRMSIKATGSLDEALDKLEATAREMDQYQVSRHSTFDDEDRHILSVMFPEAGNLRDLRAVVVRAKGEFDVSVQAKGWGDEITYEAFTEASRLILEPLLEAFNKANKRKLRLSIQTKAEMIPQLPAKAKVLFDHFVAKANKSLLHPYDWERFYKFVRYNKLRQALEEGEMKRLLRSNGFGEKMAEDIAGIYRHLEEYKRLYYKRSGRSNEDDSFASPG